MVSNETRNVAEKKNSYQLNDYIVFKNENLPKNTPVFRTYRSNPDKKY